MNGTPIYLPPTPSTLTELQHLQTLRHKLLTDDVNYPKKGVHKPHQKYKRDQSLMRLINIRLYELTGKDMYLWLSGHFKELENIPPKEGYDKLKFNLI
jgi:hypothetical protein